MNIQKLQKDDYPFLLQQITQLPPEMDIVGTLPSDEHSFLCVVGSRTYSTYGREVCRKLILGLRGYPVVIVSGLAIGMDSIAHEAALEAGLLTIGFPGSGLDPSVLYPVSSRSLAQRIVDTGGALISRFPLLQTATPWTFPTRNRLMAGISHSTLIIEARQGSGTLITATYAESFNRDVLAVPGPITSELCYGPHMLIRRGATPITSSHDILEALGFTDTTRYDAAQNLSSENTLSPTSISTSTIASSSTNTSTNAAINLTTKQMTIHLDQLDLSPHEKTICTYIQNENLSAHDLISKTGLPVSIFNITISELEMRGLVQESGGRYRVVG